MDIEAMFGVARALETPTRKRRIEYSKRNNKGVLMGATPTGIEESDLEPEEAPEEPEKLPPKKRRRFRPRPAHEVIPKALHLLARAQPMRMPTHELKKRSNADDERTLRLDASAEALGALNKVNTSEYSAASTSTRVEADTIKRRSEAVAGLLKALVVSNNISYYILYCRISPDSLAIIVGRYFR